MGDNGTRRRRAVRLTDEALKMLHQRLIEAWDELPLEGRLTRGARAGLMEVSVGTSEKILRRKGNDRAVLQQAFECVGLRWHEHFCEPMPSGDRREASPNPPGEAANSVVVTAPRAARPQARRRPLVVVWTTLGTIAACFALLFSAPTSESIAPDAPHRELMIGWKAYHAGSYAEASGHLKTAQKWGIKANDVSVVAESLRLQGEVRAAQGDLDGAIALFQDALVIRGQFRFDQARGSLLEVLGNAEAKLGRFDDAARDLTESYTVLKRNADWRGVAGTARSLGRLAALRGDPTTARKWFATAINAMKDDPDQDLLVDIKAQQAMLRSKEGYPDEALRDLQECLAEWKARGHQRWIATTLFQIAKVQATRGQIREALAAATEAKNGFALVGDQGGVAECAEWLGTTAANPRFPIPDSRFPIPDSRFP